MTAPAPRVEDAETTVGTARVHHYVVYRGVPRATLVLGHGSVGGLGSWDLQLLADYLPRIGVEVILVEQPWLVAGLSKPESRSRSDAAFREVVVDLRRSGSGLRRLVIGGRGDGARIACRTAADIRADAIFNLAFPLYSPGKRPSNRIQELVGATACCPVTVVQGERDRYGRPVEIALAAREKGARALVVSVPWSDHMFKLVKKANVTREEAGMVVTDVARHALLFRTGNEGLLFPR